MTNSAETMKKILFAMVLGTASALYADPQITNDSVITLIPDPKHGWVKVELGGQYKYEFGASSLYFDDYQWEEMRISSQAFNGLMTLKEPKTDGQLYLEVVKWMDNGDWQWKEGPKRRFFTFFLFKNAAAFLDAKRNQ